MKTFEFSCKWIIAVSVNYSWMKVIIVHNHHVPVQPRVFFHLQITYLFRIEKICIFQHWLNLDYLKKRHPVVKT